MLQTPSPLIHDKSTIKVTPTQIGDVVWKRFVDAKTLRKSEEDDWEEMFRLWRQSNYDNQIARGDAAERTGVDGDWKHRVNTGKTFEVVETLVAYFKSATFPTTDWFNVRPLAEGIDEIANLVKEAVLLQLKQAKFVDHAETFIRYLLLTGTATYRVDWDMMIEPRYTYRDGQQSRRNVKRNKLKVEACNPFDIWLDSYSRGTWGRLNYSQEDFRYLCQTGYFTATKEQIAKYDPRRTTRVEAYNAGGDQNYEDHSPEIVEFYGDATVDGVIFRNIHLVYLGKDLIRCGDSKFWCNPYVSMTMYEHLNSVYGVSSVMPMMGSLHMGNALANLRLDNLLLHMHGMWEEIEGGILEEGDRKVYPGKIWKVAQHGALSRLEMGTPNFMVTFDEARVLDANIDKATSTGPLIGPTQGRSGERVTAEEILAVRDSGGTRLNTVHTRIEERGTLPLLKTVFTFIQQFQREDIEVALMATSGETTVTVLEPDVFTLPLDILPIGADYVIETSANLDALLKLLDIASRSEQLAAKLNYDTFLSEVVKQLRIKNPQKFLVEQPPMELPPEPPPMEEPPPPEQILAEDGVANQALQQQMVEDGGLSMLNSMGMADGVTPEQLQQLEAQLGAM